MPDARWRCSRARGVISVRPSAIRERRQRSDQVAFMLQPIWDDLNIVTALK